ncbi:MAG TPA: SCO family protein [Beijerinckiaceae bacterium]|jgi:protein SCO1/2|nr:SCO family protein [Beijerinckiaceae bacterium]
MKALPRQWIAPAVVFLAGIVLIVVYFALTPSGPAAPGPSAIGGPFALVAPDGRTVTDVDFKGEPKLVFFGYTHCPDVCPTTLFDMTQVFGKLGADKKVAGIFITVDPERDTPAVMKDYMSNFDPRIVGLTGERAQIDSVLKEYHVYSRKVPTSDGDYSMDHSSIVYLMDKQGRFVNAFNLDQPADDAAKELRAYL